jgi:hypothetical protein
MPKVPPTSKNPFEVKIMDKKIKALIVKPQQRPDSDLGDVLALARSIGKKVLKTDENIRVLWTCESPYGHVVIIEGFQGNLKNPVANNEVSEEK